MKRSIFFLIALALALPLSAQAQEGVRLSLNEAINTALQSNRELQIARFGIQDAEAQIAEAKASALPTIGISGSYQRNLQSQVFYFPGADGISRPIQVGSDNVLGASATINQVIYNAALSTAIDASKTYGKISRQALRTEAAQVVSDVKRAYYAALLAREVLKVNETLLANAEENQKSAQLQFRAGIRPEFDAIRAEVQAANQRPVVVQSRDNYQAALDNLRLLLGYTDARPIELTESLVRPVSTERTEPAVAEAQGILEQGNAQLQTLKLNAEVNAQLLKIKKADYMPSLAAVGSFSYQTQFDKFKDIEFQPTSFVGLSLSYNLFNGGRTDAQVQQAEIAYEQSKLQYDQAREALRTQLNIALRRIDYARQRIATGDLTISQAQRAYTIATTSYRAGTGTQLQINDADLALAQAKLNQLNAVYDFNVSLTDLEQILGDRYQLTDDTNNVKYNAVPGE